MRFRKIISRFYRFTMLRILYYFNIGPIWPSKNALIEHYSSNTYQTHKKDRQEISDEWKRYIYEIVGENKKVLDFGCARGLLSKEMIPYSKMVVGIDFSPEFIEQAKKNLGKENAILGDVCDPPDFLPKDFDVVWCVEVIEHVMEPKKMIKAAAKHLADDGRLVLTFPKSKFTGKNPEWKNIDRHLWSFDENGIIELTEPFFNYKKCCYDLFYIFRKKAEKKIENH